VSDMPTTNVVKPTKRTTAKKRTGYNIDAEMLEEFGPPPTDDELETVSFGPVFDESFNLLKSANVWNVLALSDIEEDTAALQRYMISLVHPDDRRRFQGAMARQISLDVTRLLFILRRMTEAVADGNPTSSSSGSSRSARRAGGRALSAAKSA
jgi:hypothetical protein